MKVKHVVRLLQRNVVYRYGILPEIIADSGHAFKSFKVGEFANQHKIDWRYSSIYSPSASGLAKAFNKTMHTSKENCVEK